MPSLLLVDDDPKLIQLMGRLLGDLGRIRFATSGDAALRQAHAERPDLILLDAEMPGMNGFDTCAALKAAPDLSDVPVIFVTSHTDLDHEVRGFSVGAADFIHKPVSEHILRARVTTHLRLKQLSDELRRMANTDALTDLPNRRAFDAALAREWARSLRDTQPLCCLMVDVDHFKAYNDSYGHPAGDVCLNRVAQALRGALLRPTDMVARYGGEEFAVLLPSGRRSPSHRYQAKACARISIPLGAIHEDTRQGPPHGIVLHACMHACRHAGGLGRGLLWPLRVRPARHRGAPERASPTGAGQALCGNEKQPGRQEILQRLRLWRNLGRRARRCVGVHGHCAGPW